MRERREELAAQRILGTILQARVEPRDVKGAPAETHDFDLLFEDGPPHAVEVTMFAGEAAMRLVGQIDRLNPIAAPRLQQDWTVALDRGAKPSEHPRKLIRRLGPALEVLEAAGLTTVHRSRGRRDVPPEEEALQAVVPVAFAMAHDRESDVATITIVPPAQGGTPWGGNASASMQEALDGDRLEGERRKLTRSGRDHRHLFVWVTHTYFDAYIGMCLDGPPKEAVELPEEITRLWLAAQCPEGDIMWTTEGGAWERIILPS